MADETKGSSPFDIKTIKQLASLMTQHDLNEIELSEGELRIRLRKGFFKAAPASTLPPALPASASSAADAPLPSKPTEAAKPAKNLIPIKSPTLGTFYSSPKPGAEPYVKVGAKVTPSTIVCMIEAMKIFNEITADCSGVISEILVENQQAVEYGQVLFQVEPG